MTVCAYESAENNSSSLEETSKVVPAVSHARWKLFLSKKPDRQIPTFGTAAILPTKRGSRRATAATTAKAAVAAKTLSREETFFVFLSSISFFRKLSGPISKLEGVRE
jgi:hypothetical protein